MLGVGTINHFNRRVLIYERSIFIAVIGVFVILACYGGFTLGSNLASDPSSPTTTQSVYCYISPEMSIVVDDIEVIRETSNTYSIKKDNLTLTVPVDKCIIKSLTTENK